VVDEQHRFRVHQRMALSSRAIRSICLVRTATPIPRTMMLGTLMEISMSQSSPRKQAGRKRFAPPSPSPLPHADAADRFFLFAERRSGRRRWADGGNGRRKFYGFVADRGIRGTSTFAQCEERHRLTERDATPDR